MLRIRRRACDSSTFTGATGSRDVNADLAVHGADRYAAGVLPADGIVLNQELPRAGCWAHARRKFVDHEKAAPPVARAILRLIKGLFALEKRIKDDLAARRDEPEQDLCPITDERLRLAAAERLHRAAEERLRLAAVERLHLAAAERLRLAAAERLRRR